MNRFWIAGVIGLIIGALGVYAVLLATGMVHTFPRYRYLGDEMNRPMHWVQGHRRAGELSALPRAGWEDYATITLNDGRKLVIEVAAMEVKLTGKGIWTGITLCPRFDEEAGPTPEARDAWQVLPQETRVEATRNIRSYIAKQVATRMGTDLAAVEVHEIAPPVKPNA
ncbi:MAG: hypothetical protein ACLFV7_13275 [Phycisphaerae bacterium]